MSLDQLKQSAQRIGCSFADIIRQCQMLETIHQTLMNPNLINSSDDGVQAIRHFQADCQTLIPPLVALANEDVSKTCTEPVATSSGGEAANSGVNNGFPTSNTTNTNTYISNLCATVYGETSTPSGIEIGSVQIPGVTQSAATSSTNREEDDDDVIFVGESVLSGVSVNTFIFLLSYYNILLILIFNNFR